MYPFSLPILQHRAYIFARRFSVTSVIAAEGQWVGMGGTPLAFCWAPIKGCRLPVMHGRLLVKNTDNYR